MNMHLLPTSARALRRRSVTVNGETLPDASLFPFFDQFGRVRRIMLIASGRPEILMAVWEPGTFRIPWSGNIDVDAMFRSIDETDMPTLRTLWHFDPWWVLKDQRFAEHWATGVLKETNCVRRFISHVIMVWFRRDLSRIRWIMVRAQSGIAFRAWTSDLLPQAPLETSAEPEKRRRDQVTWELDPIWQR